jgi:hypothetical protein
MERPDDYEALGRDHGQELARLAVKMLRGVYSAAAWNEWLRHRLHALADDLRAVGSSEEEVLAWATACLQTYEHARLATPAQIQANIALMRTPIMVQSAFEATRTAKSGSIDCEEWSVV